MGKPIGSHKTGGRKKGTPNVRTEELLRICSDRNYDPVANLIDKYPSLTIENQIKVDSKLIEYIYPKPKEQTVELQPILQYSFQPADLLGPAGPLLDKYRDPAFREFLVEQGNLSERSLKLLSEYDLMDILSLLAQINTASDRFLTKVDTFDIFLPQLR